MFFYNNHVQNKMIFKTQDSLDFNKRTLSVAGEIFIHDAAIEQKRRESTCHFYNDLKQLREH